MAIDAYLATCAGLPKGDPDTALLAAHLRSAGLWVEVVVWSDPVIDWSAAPVTMIRSTWDYHTRRDEFVEWARSVSRLQNPASLVEWNTDKRYLMDLPEQIRTVPTRVLTNPTVASVRDALTEAGWTEAVIKPAIGLDGYGVSRVDLEVESDQREGAWLLQPFVKEAATDGEVSVVVINGRPTHAVRRVPPRDDFRAQERLGGTVEAQELTGGLRTFAEQAVTWLEPLPLYARVDIVWYKGEPLLMELELVEPSLFFEREPAAMDALLHVLTAERSRSS